MSLQHHNEDMSPELRKLFEDQKSAMQRFSDQVTGRAKRTWSDGRIGATDDGDLAFAIGPHPEHELVVLDFGKPVTFVAMPPQQAIEMAQALIKHARAIATTPVKIVLH
jgi:hypothetical protein